MDGGAYPGLLQKGKKVTGLGRLGPAAPPPYPPPLQNGYVPRTVTFGQSRPSGLGTKVKKGDRG